MARDRTFTHDVERREHASESHEIEFDAVLTLAGDYQTQTLIRDRSR